MSTQAFVTPPTTIPQQLLSSPMVNDKGLVTYLWTKFFQSLPFNLKTQRLIRGTHATRLIVLASGYADGSEFLETDRGVWYSAVGNSWVYKAGIMQNSQPALPTDLGPNDKGFLFYAPEYAHLLMWLGTSWGWGPGDAGSDYIVPFISGPNPATGWQACDGSAGVSKLNGDGTVVQVTMPNTPGSFYRV